jgi:hypothetical protein
MGCGDMVVMKVVVSVEDESEAKSCEEGTST